MYIVAICLFLDLCIDTLFAQINQSITNCINTQAEMLTNSHNSKLEKRTETTNLRQRYAVRLVALPYLAYWQQVPLSANTQAC